MSQGVQTLLKVGRNTADLDRATAFYRDALGFYMHDVAATLPAWTLLPGLCDAPPRCALLSLGAQHIELAEFRNAAAYPPDSTSSDLWFQHCAIVVDDMQAAYARVMAHDAMPITQGGPQRLPPSTGSVDCFKFRDPDGHPLELIHFPDGTGDPAWRTAPADGATLGIDHSAISIANLERSVLFYELLGLHTVARGVNRGVEQQHLDALAGVEVDVVAMRATAPTPHLELLGYRQPHGRVAPSTRVDAIAADRLVWQAANVDALLDALSDADFADAIVASGFIEGATIALLRDPDGHLNAVGGLPAQGAQPAPFALLQRRFR